MGIKYPDSDAVVHDFEEEAGAGGTTRPVHGLSAAVVALFTAIKNAVEGTLDVADSAVAGKIDTLIGHVDGVEGSLTSILTAVGTTLAGYLDGVETKLDTLHTDIGTTLAGYVDGLEGFVDGVEATLTSILTAVNTPGGGGHGVETIGTSESRIDSGTSHACRLVFFQNVHATQDLHFGFATGIATASSPKVRPGDWHRVPIDNTNKIYFIASGASTGMRYYYVT